MKSVAKYSILILLLFITSSYLIAQNDKEKIIVAYVNNFAKYTTWPNENLLDSFKIVVLSNNENLINEFLDFSIKRKIKDRPVKVLTNFPLNREIESRINLNAQIVLLTAEKLKDYDEIYDSIEGKPILLVSEEYNDKRFVMINLFRSKEGQLLFEVNNANIINQKLAINPEILLAGGTEIDVAGLYRRSQVHLRNMQKRIDRMEDSLEFLNFNIKKSLEQINKQEFELQNQNKILEEREKRTDSLQKVFYSQKEILKLQKDSIKIKNDFLTDLLTKIDQQKRELKNQEQYLKSKLKQIEKLNSEIELKNTELGDQGQIINRQRLVLKLSVVVGVFVVFLIITILISFRNNKLKSKLLVKQKEEIEEKLIELNRLNLKLKNADQYKSIFLASMSHELRTPLNSIIGYTGILLMGMTGNLNNEQNKQLLKVKNNANHLLSLINDILDISKIEAGKVELNNEEFKLIDVVNEVIESIQPLASEKNITITNEVNKYILITTDKRRLKQVILNLVSNAVKYNNDGNVDIFSEYLSENYFRFSVKDAGIGISEFELAKLFQPFQQIDSSLTRKNSGTGLGLYLCRKLMSLLGGYIAVKSELGKGSEFYFEMPLKI
ncbi:MAG TPA: hypothetical protein DCG75_15240 [Bacteroidales bacterium]|jgi:signal transduction histidine kinase|nr:hypothetical protein [Bacteroidales bacterium]